MTGLWLRCPEDLSEDGSKGRAQAAPGPENLKMPLENDHVETDRVMMIVLLLFFQKQNLASVVYLFGLGTSL
jgi:hypothetical protein